MVDEIVVGVDERAAADTFESARAVADVVFRFEHTGSSMPIKGSLGSFTQCEWLFVIDDDELVDQCFPEVLPDLVVGDHSHVYFPRRWIRSTSPLEYASRPPWFPDWQLRLVRNDSRLLWHSPEHHVGFAVIGTPRYEARTSLLHFELQESIGEERRRKLARYRGARISSEEVYAPIPDDALAPVEVGPLAPVLSARGVRRRPGRVIGGRVDACPLDSLPPWGARISARMAPMVTAGTTSIVEVALTNTGGLRWVPPVRDGWPILQLGYRLRSAAGEAVETEGARTPMPCVVDPGEHTTALATFHAPTTPGRYVVAWDLVSEHEAWFEWCGSKPALVEVEVVESAAP